MFDGDPDDSEDDTNEVELLLPRRETKQQAELRRSNARKRSRVALGCACNILNGTLGPGMLVLPLAFRRTGLVYGVALLVVDWALSYLALRLLLDACAHTRLTSLVQLARAHGPKMSMFVDWSVVLYFYGTCISYLILVGGTFDHLLHYYSEGTVNAAGHEGFHEALHEHGRSLLQLVEDHASPPPPHPWPPPSPALHYGPVQYGLNRHTMAEVACLACDANETYHGTVTTYFGEDAWKHAPDGGDALLSAFTLGIMLPLSCKTSLDSIGTVSTIVPMLYGYLCATVWSTRQKVSSAATATLAAYDATLAYNSEAQAGAWPVLQALPTMVYCFSTQAVYLPALEALHVQAHGPPSMMRMAAAQTRRTKRRVTDLTFLTTLLLYLSCGVGGYLRAPGGMPAPNVLDSFRPTGALMVAYVALIFALSLSFPVMFMVARTHIYSLMRHDPEGSTWRVTGVLIVGGLGIAIGFPSIEAALGLLGATCSVSLSFIIPALLYLRLAVKRDAATGERIRQPRARQAYGLIAFGVLAAALSIPVQLWEIIGEQATPERQHVPRPAGIPVRTFPRVPSINSGVIFGIVVGVIVGACVSSLSLYLCCIRGKVPRSPLLAATLGSTTLLGAVSSPHATRREVEKREVSC